MSFESVKKQAKTPYEIVKPLAPLLHLQYGHISQEQIIEKGKREWVRLEDVQKQLQEIRRFIAYKMLVVGEKPDDVEILTKRQIVEDFNREIAEILEKFDEILGGVEQV